jgi:ribosomal protein L37AE/L43A
VIHYIIFGFAALAAYVLLIAVCPVHKCPKCKGARVIRNGKRASLCVRCKGAGRTYRRGATLTHQLLHEHAGPWIRQRFRDAAGRRTGDGQ